MVFLVELVENDDDERPIPPQPACPPAFLYLAVDGTSSWRLIPSLSATVPTGLHPVFGIGHNGVQTPDPSWALIRLAVNPARTYASLLGQLYKSSEAFVNEAVDDEWTESEWVYNMIEHLEILEYLDEHVTNDWQYHNQSKMDVFVDRVARLLQPSHIIDFS